ncbi:hypothetical protein DW322_14160 [Rhodococcus rhodnii]|uniref:Uncharacterized protein n=2 Tax=Rhodococcus rhodnii TaxID=38312 RepID=R7WLZ8_9NOCA|nr:hypothetical protein [Rhodococcus rhodnii]EOM75054.1 hypothetical protein Rrhod_3667 [Rhodococcus rhodnii LMG 5362]TXG91151.1 hypothetical protein DW322_14160 [Rhodococcus rhodnii]
MDWESIGAGVGYGVVAITVIVVTALVVTLFVVSIGGDYHGPTEVDPYRRDDDPRLPRIDE